jgi:glycosyltransferase involved in cell wall biosynthesis
MKLLFITARFPYPPVKGDMAIPYYRLKRLGESHEITLLTFYEKNDELMEIDKLKPFCKEIITIKKSRIRSFLNMVIKGPFSKRPFQVLYYVSGTFKRALIRLMETNSFDIIHVYMLRMAEYAENIPLPKVLELIDSMQLNFERRLEMERFPQRFFFQVELARLKYYEPQAVKAYNRAVVVSDIDKEFINGVSKKKMVRISPGVDTSKFYPQEKPVTPRVMAFTGNMGYFPNENAIRWFMENCFEIIRRSVPDVRLVIAGKGPGKKIRRYGDGQWVTVTGEVQSIAEILRGVRLAIAPMRSGSGMQFKILEAMACGLPVVTTTLGLGAIPARHNKEIIVADDAESFADLCVRILTDDALAVRVGVEALKLVKEEFTWEHNAAEIEKIYESVSLEISSGEKENV